MVCVSSYLIKQEQWNQVQINSLVMSSNPSQNSLIPELDTTWSLQLRRSPWWSANSWLKESAFHRVAFSRLWIPDTNTGWTNTKPCIWPLLSLMTLLSSTINKVLLPWLLLLLLFTDWCVPVLVSSTLWTASSCSGCGDLWATVTVCYLTSSGKYLDTDWLILLALLQ